MIVSTRFDPGGHHIRMTAETNLVRLCGHAKGGYHPMQVPLIGFEPEVQQQLDSVWQQQAQSRAEQTLKKIEKARQQAAIRIRSAIQSGFLWPGVEKLLEKPLGVYMPTDLDIQPEAEAHRPEHDSHGMSINDIKEAMTWSDEAIVDLHHGLLMYSLGVLNSKGNVSEKKQTLSWIWSDDIFDVVARTVKGVTRYVPIRADQIPFTFQTCCRLNGYHHEEIRDGAAWAMRGFLRQIGFDPAESNL